MAFNLSLCGLASAIVCLACDPRVCADQQRRASTLPERLSETGLFADVGQQQLAPRVFAYTPAFALWSDGAEKRRWVFVPAGAQVDTRDPDAWQFPEGTKLWKEFSHQGVRLETPCCRRLDRVPLTGLPLPMSGAPIRRTRPAQRMAQSTR